MTYYARFVAVLCSKPVVSFFAVNPSR